MNLDELATEIGNVTADKAAEDLSIHLMLWKDRDETADELKVVIERYLANARFDNNEDYEKIYSIWSSFRDEAIIGIDGMTINERLYRFSLFETTLDQKTLYKKLHTSP